MKVMTFKRRTPANQVFTARIASRELPTVTMVAPSFQSEHEFPTMEAAIDAVFDFFHANQAFFKCTTSATTAS